MADAMQPPADSGEGGGDQFTQLVENINSGLLMLQEVVGESGLDPKSAEALAKVSEAFQQAVDGMMGAAQGAQQVEEPAPMEAGASGAQPMNPAVR